MIAGAYDWTDDMLKIKSMQKKFRDSFNGTEINPARWEIAATGGDVIVTKHGRPVVRVGPATIAPASPTGFMRGTIVRHGDLISPDEEGWATTETDPLRARAR